MSTTVAEVEELLRREGLHVSSDENSTIIVAAHVKTLEDGVEISNDSCAMFPKATEWVAVFPGAGQRTYEVPGDLADLVRLVISVYRDYRVKGGSLSESLRQTVNDPEHYLK